MNYIVTMERTMWNPIDSLMAILYCLTWQGILYICLILPHIVEPAIFLAMKIIFFTLLSIIIMACVGVPIYNSLSFSLIFLAAATVQVVVTHEH